MSIDMSKVKVGARVRYQNGKDSVITCVDINDNVLYPFCTNGMTWHKPDGSCCADTRPDLDIVEILHVKPPRKGSAPLYNELLTERELLKIENHNMKVQLDTVKNSTLFGVLTWWFHNRKGEWK